MSLFQEEFANSQHDFAEVLDDETTTSGVLEISSSSSFPTSAKVPAVVAIDDTSSTDTIKLIEVSNQVNCQNEFFSTSEIYVINDDDDDVDDVDDDVDDVDDEVQSRVESLQTNADAESEIVGGQLNGVIVTASGATIYLETPVVEEQQHHPQIINLSGQVEFMEKAGKPKRLSDEFLLAENAETVEEIGEEAATDALHNTAPASLSNVAVFSFKMAEGSVSKSKSEDNTEGNNVSESQHDHMSVRFKEINISNSTTHDSNVGSSKSNAIGLCKNKPSTSQTITRPTESDIESMDLIERSDFETEQRLTESIILKTTNRNKLNLSLIKTCIKQQNPHEKHGAIVGDDDDCPGSSNNGRAVSSDSKCAYKDLSTTPTSSRNYTSRLTKSTAKLNLCSTLSRSEQQQQQQHHLQQTETERDIDTVAAPSNCPSSSVSSTSTAAAAAPSTSANVCNIVDADGAELFSNFNSNDSLADGTSTAAATTTTNCQQEQQQQQSNTSKSNHQPSSAVDLGSECTHNNVLQPSVSAAESEAMVFDDPQPSTSSARCQYALPSKALRQVHASAQTNERYLTRGTLAGAIATTSVAAVSSSSNSSSGGINLSTVNRNRRRMDPTVNLTRNSTSAEVIAAFQVVVAEAAAAEAAAAAAAAAAKRGDFNEDPWADCDENNSDVEEICTCHSNSSHGGSNTSLNETDELDGCVKDADLSNYIQMVSITEETAPSVSSALSNAQRKRKYNESRLIDGDNSAAVSSSGGGNCCDANSRKRIAYDYSSTPRSSQNVGALMLVSSPPAQLTLTATNSPIGRRTPRSIIPTRDNPPPELQNWLSQFQRWSHAERILAVDRLIEHCEPTQVRHMMKVIEPQFQRDFISLLPRELALQVLAYLAPKDLLRAAQTCRSWRFLCDDNLLWKEKCRKAQILTEPRTDRPKRGRAGNMPPIASPWKAAYMRQHIIEMNWRSRPIREPKVLKGHDDHVITCLQFSGNRIVSGSDDNTLKVWSAVTGRCLRTLVGHTGGVWSSQMAGNIIISGSTDRTLKVWDMETGQCVHTLLGHTSTVRCMHLHGNKVVSGSRDATLRVWDIEQGTCLHVLVGHLAAVRCVQYDGKLIVSGAYDYMVKIWHPERQECLHTLQGHTNRVYSLQFDGLHVVSGSLDTSIRVWDVETGNCKHTLMGHQSLTSGMELRQNILVSGNADSTVKVWDITTGQCLQTLSGPNKHQSAVTCLQFNSRFVVTSSDDGTVKLWDVKTGEFIRNLVALDSGGSGGVVWRIRANDTKLICAVGSRNGTEETKLMVLDFDVEGACVKCS